MSDLVACWCRSDRRCRRPHRWPGDDDLSTGRCVLLGRADHLDGGREDDADDGRNGGEIPKSTVRI